METDPDRDAAAAAFRPSPLAITLSVAAAAAWLPQAFILADAIAAVVLAAGDRPDEAAGGATVSGLLAAAALFLALSALRAALDAGSHLAASRRAEAAKLALRRRLVARLAVWSPADTTRPATGEIAGLAGAEIESLDPFLLRYGPARARLMVMPLVILAVTFAWSWAAGLLLLLAGPIIPVLMSLIGAAARERSAEQLAEVGTLTGTLLDKVAGLTTIRLFGAEDATAAAIEDAGERIRRRTMAVLRLAFLSSAVLELFAAIGVGLIAVYVGFHLIGWIGFGATGGTLDLAGGLFILFLAPDFFQPLRDFAAAYHDKAAAEAARARFADLVETPRPEIVGGLSAPEAEIAGAPPGPLAVAADRLVVAAPDGRVMLPETSLAVAAGERVALMAPSGAGKTSLLAALAGLLAPASGTITLGGIPLDETTAAALRRRIAFVGQSPHFERGSLRANLTLARPEATADDLAAALALAACDFTDHLPRGLSTRLGEGGHGLSGGERRRLALARAALARAGLVLADEPTASLDAEAADAVRDGLLALAAGRTLIVATHDERLAAAMDRVIRLEGSAPPGCDPAASDRAISHPASSGPRGAPTSADPDDRIPDMAIARGDNAMPAAKRREEAT